ncbi:hypothetical protein P0D71_17890 [Paraburkholderia sp. RL17-383-BIF-A]|uniref:hypothetical protein n=1 Tax=Paraburkholderia sp. RL17-383-BIF-A TaxID=3031631 RepID=UPI0038B6DB74
MLDFYPTRSVHFEAWDGTQNCQATHALFPSLSSFKTTRRSTLAGSHSDLQDKLDAVLEVLRAKGHEQLLMTNKTSLLEKLESQAHTWEMLARKQESDIVALRERMAKTEVELRASTLALENNASEHTRVVDLLNAKIANLTNLLSKVAPLKG